MVKSKDEALVLILKELVRKIAGKTSEPIVDVLFNKKNVNEFKIAEKLKITINQARNILYRLSSYGILDSTRKKDKRKGWYTYFWTLNIAKALEVFNKLKVKEIDLLEQVLKSHQLKQFYICTQDNIEMSEETAMQHSYLCPECGLLLQPLAKEKKIKEITSKIEAAKRELNLVKAELDKYKPKPLPPKIKKVKKKEVKGKKKIKKKSKEKNKSKKSKKQRKI
ncbi:MAG: hypothetical protein ACPLXC_02325 [Candidatus Pacearchaeota archaeon]